jgi:hypothetical protein
MNEQPESPRDLNLELQTVKESISDVEARQKTMWARFKAKGITGEEYSAQYAPLKEEWDALNAQLSKVECELRVDYIKQTEQKIIPDEKIGYVDSLDLENTIETLLGENIQKGGGNAEGVYDIPSTGLVVIVKPETSYEHRGDLTYLTQQLNNNPRIPRTLKVFVKDGKTYQIMERVTGTQVDLLSIDILENIPQEHYNQFVQDLHTLNDIGLMIDPSKRSNFFYDPDRGFCFIDLAHNKIGYFPSQEDMRAALLGSANNEIVEGKLKQAL